MKEDTYRIKHAMSKSLDTVVHLEVGTDAYVR